ncbi:hypothetical protein FRB97_002314 [Tulasnella sp. 331]|nr:hypothetical protein FRB97_002314 [Tulasnella sp. 331]
MAAGFGQADSWVADTRPPPGQAITFHQSLLEVINNVPLRALLPQWVWGSQTGQNVLAVGGLSGRGWLGKRVQRLAVAYSELAMYMKEMLNDELEHSPGQKQRERGNIFSNLVSAMGNDVENADPSKNDLFGDMFIFLLGGFETSVHALAYTFGFIALDQEEQQLLYDHIESVLEDREPTYTDISKLTRVLAVFLEALRLYPAGASLPKTAAEDSTFTAKAAIPEGDLADPSNLGEKEKRQTTVFVPKGSEVLYDIAAVHHNPRYWPEPYSFKPERFLDPNWPKEAFISFSTGSRGCMGRRFAEVEAIAIITLIIRRYKVSVDPLLCPDVVGESKVQRRDRVLKSYLHITITPHGIPLLFTKR